ncbi:MAG: thiolase domain-containing protein [Candidatus Bathyarchaeota archaeon]|nr:MAG: thiolase domain-containing protein [Candidatus Bathyarchaeota archaeon]
MRKVAVIGVGHSKFGVRKDVNLSELTFEAVKPAIDDAGVTRKDIDFVSFATVGGMYEEALPAVVAAEYSGLTGAGLVRCEAACASGSAAFFNSYLNVASGQVDISMAVGIEKMTEVDTPTMMEMIGRAGSYLWEFHNFGMTFPAYYALYASAHMARFGTTEEDMAEVAVKAHKYGAMNPNARFQRETSVDEVLSSYLVAWPLKLYDCSPICDGSAAVVLASEEKVRELGVDTPIWVSGVGYSSDTANLSKRPDFVGLRASVSAADKAYKMAGVGPGDLDVANVHDCFTIAEIMAYEDLGFCERSKGAEMVREGMTEVDGEIPVNVDGGLKAKGHPIGATGCSMIYELTTQLRDEVESRSRQVPLDSYTALAHNVGGTGHYCYVTIIRRE